MLGICMRKNSYISGIFKTYCLCSVETGRQFENSEMLLFNIQFAFDLRSTLRDAPRGIGQINV